MISIMNRKMLCVLILAALGIFHRSAESLKITDGITESDDWLSKVIEGAEIRRKRHDDDVPDEFYEHQPQDFDERHWEGMRQNSIVRVWSKDTTLDNEKQCLGVVVHMQVIITPCSCVAYQKNGRKITPEDHKVERQKLTPIHGSEINFELQSVGKGQVVVGDTTVLHPRCDNYFEVDLAAVITNTPLKDSKLVWVHTAENILFDNNVVRAVAAQAVTGKCTVPVLTRYKKKGATPSTRYDFLPIFFQNWAGCLQNVCPRYRGLLPGEQNATRCNNKYGGTRYCMGWKVPELGLCELMTGTPVFCEIGEIQGFMGLLVRNVYQCPSFERNQGIMQGFNDGISWIRYILELGTYDLYELHIPDWVKNTRNNYLPESKIRPVPDPRKLPIAKEFDFSYFEGSQTEAIVSIYWKKVFKCYGTIVGLLTVVVPCSCVSTTNKKVTNEKWYKEHERVTDMDIDQFEVLGLANYMRRGVRRYIKIARIEKHNKCDNHYLFDYAMIELENVLAPPTRVAWVMTLDKTIFTKILLNLPQADLVYGNCYYIHGEFRKHVGSGATHFVPRTRRIQFENWNTCLHIVCSEKILKSWTSSDYQKGFIEERCLQAVIGDPSEKNENPTGTRYCISADPYDGHVARPLCDVVSGTPIFCNVEEARGFVGFIGGAWTHCPDEGTLIEKDRAIFFGIDQFIDVFKSKTFLSLIEDLYKARSSARSLLLTSPIHPLLICTTVIVYNIGFVL